MSASEGKITCELTIEQEHTNAAGSLHGGLTATLVDGISTFAIVSASYPPGVSTDLNVRYKINGFNIFNFTLYYYSYLRPAPLGKTVIINAQCSKIGKTLAFATVDISDKDTGKLIAQGRHTKYIAH